MLGFRSFAAGFEEVQLLGRAVRAPDSEHPEAMEL